MRQKKAAAFFETCSFEGHRNEVRKTLTDYAIARMASFFHRC